MWVALIIAVIILFVVARAARHPRGGDAGGTVAGGGDRDHADGDGDGGGGDGGGGD